MGLRDWLAQHHDHADPEIAQGADFEPSTDPVADRAVFMRDAARVVGHGTREYQKGLERSEEFENDPAGAESEASRVFGERMREIGQGSDSARAREIQVAADVAERDDHEIDAGVDDEHCRHLGMGIG
jgi:hypothetical protein